MFHVSDVGHIIDVGYEYLLGGNEKERSNLVQAIIFLNFLNRKGKNHPQS